MQHYTTIKQSKKLVELGLNPDTADMFYSKRPTIKSEYSVFPDFKPEGRLEVFTKVDLPCWSLGALLELMPIIDDNSYSLSGTLNKGALCKHPCTSVMFQEESPLEAVYNMICWLLERNYIKKGE